MDPSTAGLTQGNSNGEKIAPTPVMSVQEHSPHQIQPSEKQPEHTHQQPETPRYLNETYASNRASAENITALPISQELKSSPHLRPVPDSGEL